MAAELYGGLVSLGAAATDLCTLLSAVTGALPLSHTQHVTANVLTLRADSANAGTVYVELSSTLHSSSKLGFIDPGESISIDLFVPIDVAKVFLSGTPGDKAYVMGVEY